MGYPGQLLQSMPDLSVAYKLLLENGQQVNIYDWLVAFSSVIDGPKDEEDDDDGNANISQDIQYVPSTYSYQLQYRYTNPNLTLLIH